MPNPRGIRYYSFVDFSGYAQAAIAHVRAFVNAGIPLQWIPLDWHQSGNGGWSAADGRLRPLLERQGDYGHLADLATLVERTRAPVDHDVVIVHAPPEYWPGRAEPERLNVGYVAWETSCAPAHWLPLLRRVDRVVAPCTQNGAAFRRAGFDGDLRVVPHIRRHAWREYAPQDVAAARADLGIPADYTVLYTISSWDPRKALAELIHVFATAFSATQPVALLIKTERSGFASGPLYPRIPTRDLATDVITAAARELRRPAPLVVLHDEQVSGDDIDLVHAVGDVFVSLSHGEGWGLGAFEAATLAKPVIMTGWGGHTDFLGPDWSGAIPYRLVPVPLCPPSRPSYFPSQRWAQPDLAATVQRMRGLLADPDAAFTEAQVIRERIVRDFAEPIVVARFLQALQR